MRPAARFWNVLLLGFLPLLAGAPLFRAGFSFDDLHSVAENPHIRTLENVPRFFADPACFSSNPNSRMYRPVLLLSYALNHQAAGLAPWAWHLVNALLHLLAVQGLHRLLLAFFPGRAGLALGAAALFAVHPLHVELVGHVSSRSDLLCAACSAWALLLLVRDRVRPRAGLLAGAWLLHAAALLSKEPALLFPLAAFPLLLCVPAGRRGGLARAAAGLAPMLLTGAGYLLLRHFLLGRAAPAVPRWTGGVDPLTGWGRDLATQASSQLAALGRGIELLFWPWRLSADHQIPLVSSPLAGPALAGGCLLALFLAGSLCLARPRRLAAAGLWWVALFLAPAVLVPLNQLFAEHRLYAPGLGLAVLLAAAASGGSRLLAAVRRRAARQPAGLAAEGVAHGRAYAWPPVPLLVLLLLFGARTFLRGLDWKDPGTLWAATLATDPGSVRAWSELGQFRAERGDTAGARAAFRRARTLHPRNLQLALNEIEYAVREFEAGGPPALLQQALALAEESASRAPWLIGPRAKLCRVRLALARAAGERVESRQARLAVEAALSGLTFTSYHPVQLAVVAMALEGAGQEQALDPFWGWAERLVRLDEGAWRVRLEQLLRLGRTAAAARFLNAYLRAAGPRADPLLTGRIQALTVRPAPGSGR